MIRANIILEAIVFNKAAYLFISFLVVLSFSCAKNRENAVASMEQLHAENGIPVSVRKLDAEDFSVFLKYPGLIEASSESTASAALEDVVRTVSARVGETVREGDIIVSFSEDNRTLAQAVLSHGNARTAFERASALFRSNDISRQDFDSVRMQYEISTTNLKAANDMVYVKAPISGTITQLNVRVTQNVRPGTALFTVSNSNAFEAKLHVGMNEIGRIKTGARAFIESQNIEGRITQVSLAMDSQKQAFPVTVVFNGAHSASRLVSGMNVDVSVETYRSDKAIILAQRELVRTDTGPTVFIPENNRVRQIAVQTGAEKGLQVEIIGGLREGDMIVSEGVQHISSESKIIIVPGIIGGR